METPKESNADKDVWDKLDASSGILTVISSIIIAAAGFYFTTAYQSTQTRIAELGTSEKMLVHLQNGDRESEAALDLMSTLSRPEVAAAMARLYGGKGAIEAMKRLAMNAPTKNGRKAAEDALRALTAQSTAAEAKAAAAALSAVTAQSTPAPSQQIVVVNSGPKPSGAEDKWSDWYTLCGTVPPTYKVDTSNFRLVGDRSCGAWAECREVQQTDQKVCYQFRMQGHNEQPPPGIAESEGILQIVAKR